MTDQDASDELEAERYREAQAAAEEAVEHLQAVVNGESEGDLGEALRVAAQLASEAHDAWKMTGRLLEISRQGGMQIMDLVRGRVKELRTEAGLTQQELADDMVRLGFVTWKRITVAEVESTQPGNRRLSIEEMLGLSVLFGRSLDEMVGLTQNPIMLNEFTAIARSELSALLGSDGRRGDGRRAAEAAALIAGVEHIGTLDDWRPFSEARGLHRRGDEGPR